MHAGGVKARGQLLTLELLMEPLGFKRLTKRLPLSHRCTFITSFEMLDVQVKKSLSDVQGANPNTQSYTQLGVVQFSYLTKKRLFL